MRGYQRRFAMLKLHNINLQMGRSLHLSCAKDTPSSFERRVQNRYTSEKVASRFAQIGRSMIEMLGVLAIIGVLSVGGIAGYSKAMTRHKTNQTAEQVTQIVTNVHNIFGSKKSYKALKASNQLELIGKTHMFPDALLQVTGTGDARTFAKKNHAFDGTVTIEVSGKREEGDEKAFILTFTNIPQTACIDLAVIDWGGNNSSGLIAFAINASDDIKGIYLDTEISAQNTKITKSGPMRLGAATTNCGKFNTLSWKFY